MMIAVKRLAVMLLPPIVTDAIRRIRHGGAAEYSSMSVARGLKNAIRAPAPEWEVVDEAQWTVSDGWLHPSIVDTQVAKWPGFAESIDRPKALGVAHEALPGAPVNVSSHNIMMTFAYVLGRAIATNSGRPVSVLDWGGGIGHYALLAQQLYPENVIRYTVAELQPLAEAGQKLVPEAQFTSDGIASLQQEFDLVYASSSLQYVRDIYGLLGKIAESGSRWVMICRMPFIDNADDFIVIQRPQRYGYDTEYTGWFLNRTKFVDFMRRHGYVLDREFLNDERPTVVGAPEQCSYRGFLFQRSREEPPATR